MYILRNSLVLLILNVTFSKSSPVESRFKTHKNFHLLPKISLCGIHELQDKVHGGNATKIGEFPWMVLLEYKKKEKNNGYQCAGSLINEKYILTAAHCVTGEHKETLGDVVKVRLGEYDFAVKKDCIQLPEEDEECSDDPLDIQVEEIVPHNRFNYDGININDIALIRLKTSVKFTQYIRPICLPLNGEESNPGEILTVAGWGYTESGERSTKKLQADLPIIPNDNCTRSYRNKVTIHNSQICAGGEIGIDSCLGDSGGPLMKIIPGKVNYYVDGIVSFGPRKCGTIVPAVYTKVGSFVEWILDNIKE